MSVVDIAEEVSMPRPSVHRLLDALERVELIAIRDDGQAQLGTQILHLASPSLEGGSLCSPAMSRLNELTGQTVYLCAVRNQLVTCLDWVRLTKVTLLLLNPGGSLPPHAGATSRAILAWDDELRGSVTAAAPLQGITPRTLVTAEQVEADAQAIRERGYSVSDEDVTVGVAALGVPLFDSCGKLRGALSVAGLRDDVLPHQDEYVALLQKAAKETSAKL